MPRLLAIALFLAPGILHAGSPLVAQEPPAHSASALVDEPILPRALAGDEAAFGKDLPGMARALNHLAPVLSAMNYPAAAELLMRRALAIDQDFFGKNESKVATDLHRLAALLQATGRLAEIEPRLRHTLESDEAVFGKDSPKVADDLTNLALLLQATQQVAEAKPLMRRALAINEAYFGLDHPRVARRLFNLIMLGVNQNTHDRPLTRRAIDIAGTYFEDDNRNFIYLDPLAQLLQDTNQSADVERLLRRALEIAESSFDPNHPKIAYRLDDLAQFLQSTNRLEEAEPLLRRSLAISEAAPRRPFGSRCRIVDGVRISEPFSDKDDPRIGIRLNNLAVLLQATNRLNEAEPLLRRALEKAEAVGFGYGEFKVALRLNNLGRLLQAMQRPAEAEPLLRRALQLGGVYCDEFADRNNLAQLLQDTGRRAEAEPLLRQALEDAVRSTETTRHEDPNLRAAMRNYFDLLTKMGFPRATAASKTLKIVEPINRLIF